MRTTFCALLVTTALYATSATAQDRIGFTAIRDGNLASAERTLAAEQRMFPNRPEIMLNLAAVYARTGRPEEARELYRQVIAAPDVLMDLPSGRVAGAHLLADAGLKRLSLPEISSR